MQVVGKKPLQVKNVCALIFCLSIIILGMICCGYGRNFNVTSPLARLSTGQCKGNNVAPVVGEQTLAVATQEGLNVTICIFRANDGRLLRHYDLTTYGTILGSGDGLLYMNGNSDLCAIHISDGIERWCQPRQNASSIIVGNGNVYATSGDSNQPLITALSEHDGRVLWSTSITAAPNSINHLLLVAGPEAIYSYQTIPTVPSTPTTPTNQTSASDVNSVCALRASDGRQLWCNPLVGQNVSGMVADENSLYVRYDGDYPLMDVFNAASGAVRWHKQLNQNYGANAFSLLTVINGIVFTDTASSNNSSDRLYAIQASDGKQLWNTSQPGLITSIAATDKGVYVVTRSGDLHALNILNGTSAWSYRSSLEGTQTPYYDNYYDRNYVNNIIVEHNVAYSLINTNNYAYLSAVSTNDRTALWQDQRCDKSAATSIASPGTASNKSTTGRCYWVNDSNTRPGNMRLSLLEADN